MNYFSVLFGNTRYSIKVMTTGAFALSILAAVMPFVFIIVSALSLQNFSFSRFVHIVGDPRHLASLANSFFIAFVAAVLITILSFVIALFFRKINLTGNRIIYALAIIPIFIPDQVFGIAGRIVFDPSIGIFADTFSTLIINRYSSLILVVLFVILKWLPLMIVLCDAVIGSIPKDEYYQTIMDHRSFFRQVKYTYYPYSQGILILIFSIMFLIGFRQHEMAFELTSSGGGFVSETWSLWNYKEIFEFVNFGSAAIEALIVLILLLIPIIAIKNQAQKII